MGVCDVPVIDCGHPRSEFNRVVVGAEFSPKLAEVLEARQRRRLRQIDDAPHDRMHHMRVTTPHRLIKPREHFGIGLGPFLEDSIEVELQDTFGRSNPIDLNVFFSCNYSALRRLSLTDLAILACCSDDLVQSRERVCVRDRRLGFDNLADVHLGLGHCLPPR